MNVLVIAQAVIGVAIVVVLVMVARGQFVTERLYDVAKAQYQRRDAYDALAAAKRSGADLSAANAAVAVAEVLVKKAEARLPRRSKNTRAHFASKEKA